MVMVGFVSRLVLVSKTETNRVTREKGLRVVIALSPFFMYLINIKDFIIIQRVLIIV